MFDLQKLQIKQRKMWWEFTMQGLFLLTQVSCMVLIYIHDSQSLSIPLAIITTFAKTMVIGAITIQLLRIIDQFVDKQWLHPIQERTIFSS